MCGLNAFYWRQSIALDSAVVSLIKWFISFTALGLLEQPASEYLVNNDIVIL